MNKPYIFCHMMTSLDGKIMENYLNTPEGNFVAKKTDMYYVSVDPTGRLGWKGSTLSCSDTKAHVLEVLTEKAGNVYNGLQSAEVRNGGSVWLRYRVRPAEGV